MSMMTCWVPAALNTDTFPAFAPVPTWTVTWFDTVAPALTLTLDTVGWAFPAGHRDR